MEKELLQKAVSDVKEMISPDGFEKAFWIICKYLQTRKEAYEMTELEYIRRYGAGTKYSSYKSFRETKNRRSKTN